MAFKPKKKTTEKPKEGSPAEERTESKAKEASEPPDANDDPIGHAKHHLSAQEGDGHGVRVNVGAGSHVHVHAPVSPGESPVAPNPATQMQGQVSPVMTEPTIPAKTPYNPVQEHHDKLRKKNSKGSASNPKGSGAASASGSI